MLPEAFLLRMQETLGGEYPEFLASYDKPRAQALRLNQLKKTERSFFPDLLKADFLLRLWRILRMTDLISNALKRFRLFQAHIFSIITAVKQSCSISVRMKKQELRYVWTLKRTFLKCIRMRSFV